MGTIFHPIILVDILKNVFEFSLTALLEIKFKLVGRRNFMSLVTVKLQQELLRELIIDFFPFGFVCIKSLSRGIYLHTCIAWTQSQKTTNPSFEWARLSFYCDSDHRKENYNFQIAGTFAIFTWLWIWICPNTSYCWRCWNVHSQTY